MCLLALNAGFADLGGWSVAASDVHPSYHPLSRHVNDIVSVEMTETPVPSIDGDLRPRVVGNQHSLRRVFTLSGEGVQDHDVSRLRGGDGGYPHDIETSAQVTFAGNSLVLVKDGTSLSDELHLRAALSKV